MPAVEAKQHRRPEHPALTYAEEDSANLPALPPALLKRDSTAQTAAAVAHWRPTDIADTQRPERDQDDNAPDPADPAVVDTLAPDDSALVRKDGRKPFTGRETITTEIATPSPFPGARYELLERVGQGGFGEVWRARQSTLNRLVAVKRVRHSKLASTPSTDDGEQERLRLEMDFRHEAMTTAQLEHPNIVPVHDLGLDSDGLPLLAMKFLKGASWDKLLKEDFPKLPPHEFLAKHLPVMLDMTQAVAFAHSRGVIHRDLKPAQVMVGEFGETVLMDWGLAVLVDAERLAAAVGVEPARAINSFATLETASNPSGTPAMMAPEQTDQSTERLGYWTDVYLLGGTLYHLLTGSYPHVAQNSTQAMRRAMLGEVEPPEVRAAARDVPAELSSLCMRALSADPEERVASAMEFLGSLKDYLSGASKRRESELLARHAEQRFEESAGSYSELNECLNLLARARGLWPHHPGLAEARERVLERMAKAALGNGDLTLAKLQVDGMYPSPRRAELSARVDRLLAKAARRESQRRLAIAAAIILLVACAIAALFAQRNYADRMAADDAAQEQHRLKNFFEGVERLRSRELALARDLSVELPLPMSFLAPDDRAGGGLDEARAKQLLATRDDLRASRVLLASLAPTGFHLDAEPFDLVLGKANLALREATTPERLEAALRLYDEAAADRPDLAEPIFGRGVALARMGRFEDSIVALESAIDLLGERGGEEHPLRLRALEMLAQAYHGVDSAAERARETYATGARTLERRMSALSLGLARQLAGAGRPMEALAYAERALEIEAKEPTMARSELSRGLETVAEALEQSGATAEATRLRARFAELPQAADEPVELPAR